MEKEGRRGERKAKSIKTRWDHEAHGAQNEEIQGENEEEGKNERGKRRGRYFCFFMIVENLSRTLHRLVNFSLCAALVVLNNRFPHAPASDTNDREQQRGGVAGDRNMTREGCSYTWDASMAAPELAEHHGNRHRETTLLCADTVVA